MRSPAGWLEVIRHDGILCEASSVTILDAIIARTDRRVLSPHDVVILPARSLWQLPGGRAIPRTASIRVCIRYSWRRWYHVCSGGGAQGHSDFVLVTQSANCVHACMHPCNHVHLMSPLAELAFPHVCSSSIAPEMWLYHVSEVALATDRNGSGHQSVPETFWS